MQRPGSRASNATVPADTVAVVDLLKAPSPWFKKGLCPDGAFALVNADSIRLVVVECKRTLHGDELAKALRQGGWGTRRLLGLLAALALDDLLALLPATEAVFVPAYRTDAVLSVDSPDLIAPLPTLGSDPEDVRALPSVGWARGRVAFDHVDVPVRLVKLELDSAGRGRLEL